MPGIEEFVNKIHEGNCANILKNIPSESIDLILTDPPYLSNYKSNLRKSPEKADNLLTPVSDETKAQLEKEHDFKSEIKGDGYEDRDVIREFLDESLRVMKPDTAIYAFCNSVHVEFFKTEMDARFNVKNIIVWVKNGFSAGDLEGAFGRKHEFIIMANKGRAKFRGERIGDVWEFDRVTSNNQLHQNQKPVELLSLAIRKHSDYGGIILDPFAGSGSTLVAAKMLGRRYIGIEFESKYCEIAERRLSLVAQQPDIFEFEPPPPRGTQQELF